MIKITACNNSAVVPIRLIGVAFSYDLIFASVSAARVLGVSMKPGAIAAHLIPNIPNSLAQVTVSAFSADLVAEYADCPILP